MHIVLFMLHFVDITDIAGFFIHKTFYFARSLTAVNVVVSVCVGTLTVSDGGGCRHSKQRVIYEGHQRITGLAFRLAGKSHVLFVATEGEVICITLLPKDKEHKVCSARMIQ